jgi:hypothetical protein
MEAIQAALACPGKRDNSGAHDGRQNHLNKMNEMDRGQAADVPPDTSSSLP